MIGHGEGVPEVAMHKLGNYLLVANWIIEIKVSRVLSRTWILTFYFVNAFHRIQVPCTETYVLQLNYLKILIN